MNIDAKVKRSLFLSAAVFSIFIAAAIFFSSSAFAAPGINKQIPYQGVLKNSSGVNVPDGNYDMLFRIYDAPSGGTALWTEYRTAASTSPVSVSDGLFRVMLGAISAISLDFNGDTYWLGVKVGSDSEMTPRQRIGAAGYAFNSDTVDGIGFATTTLSIGDILYVSASNLLQRLGVGTDGQVLKLKSGLPSWGSDLSGGSSVFATTTDGLAIYPVDTTDVLVLGANATTTSGNILEVAGNSLFKGNGIFTGLFTSYGTASASVFTATSTSATSTFPYLSVPANSNLGTVIGGTWNGSPISDAYVNDDITASNYLSLSDWFATTTHALISSLPSLFVTESQISNLNHFDGGDFYAYFSATTTDALSQGAANKYYSASLFASDLAGTTTDALAEGSTNKYWSNSLWDSRFAATTTTGLAEGSNLYWTQARFDTAFSGKSTTDLSEGTNLYYTSNRVAGVIAATTTDALSEGSANLYFTDVRTDARINATSTIGTLTSLPNLAAVGTITGGTWNGSPISDAYVNDDITASNYLSLSDWFATTTAPHLTTLLGLTNASSTQLSVSGQSWFAGLATFGNATSTQLTNTGLSWLNGTTTAGIINVTDSIILPDGTPSITTNALYSNSGVLYWNGSSLDAAAGGTEGQTIVINNGGTQSATSTLFISSAGNTGIGITSPTNKLEVSGTRSNTINYGNAIAGIGGSDVRIAMGALAGTPNWGTWIQSQTTGDATLPLVLNPNGGNVGIGTSSPAGALQIQIPALTDRDADNQHVIIGNGDDDDYGIRMGFTGTDGYGLINVLNPSVAWGNLILQDGGGRVGVGTTSPAYKLDVGGSINVANGSTYKINGSDLSMDNLSDAQKDTVNANFFIGHSGGSVGSNDNYNTAVGINALASLDNSGGDENTAVGNYALSLNTSYYNDAFGYRTLESNTTGNGNTAFGRYALSKITTGTNNVAMGSTAGTFTDTQGSNNTTGSQSVFIGSVTKAQNDGQTNQIVIGYGAIGAGSNSVVLGNDNIANTVLKGNLAVNLSLGSTASFDLAIGDYDTGIDWVSDGVFNMMANNKTFAQINAGSTNGFVLDVANALAGNSCDSINEVLETTANGNIRCGLEDSDERLKNIIEKGNILYGLDEIVNTPLVRFTWKDQSEVPDHSMKTMDKGINEYQGFSAQELLKTAPELVVEGYDGYYGLDSTGLIATAWNAIRELNAKVDENISQNKSNSLVLNGTAEEFMTDQENGGTLSVNKVIAKEELCIGDAEGKVCLNKEELAELKTLLSGVAVSGREVNGTPEVIEPEPARIGADENNENALLDEDRGEQENVGDGNESDASREKETVNGDTGGETKAASVAESEETEDTEEHTVNKAGDDEPAEEIVAAAAPEEEIGGGRGREGEALPGEDDLDGDAVDGNENAGEAIAAGAEISEEESGPGISVAADEGEPVLDEENASDVPANNEVLEDKENDSEEPQRESQAEFGENHDDGVAEPSDNGETATE